MPNPLGGLVLDGGQGPSRGFSLGGRDDLVDAFRTFVDARGSFGELTLNANIPFGTDTGPSSLAGLPGINLNNASPEYSFTHDSAADALEAVDADVLARNATILALTAYWIAARPERLASP